MKRSSQPSPGVLLLKKALEAAITDADFSAISRQLIQKARDGNASAAKLVLEMLAAESPGLCEANRDLFRDDSKKSHR